MLLSLAGIPLTVGFIGKFYIFTAGTAATLWWLLLAVVLGSILGLYYYLRVVITMFRFPASASQSAPLYPAAIPLVGRLTLVLLALLLLWWGVYPDPLIRLITQTAAMAPL